MGRGNCDLNLYLLEQYDKTSGSVFAPCVVCAENETEAKNTHPANESYSSVDQWSEFRNFYWARSPEMVDATLIGVADASIQKGVLFSYIIEIRD